MSAAPRTVLPADALRLLERLAGTALATDGFDAAAADALIAADLARRGPNGRLAITPPGRAFLARRAAPRRQRDVDPFRAQHLSLARATVPTAEGRAAVTIDAAESPLLWLARRKGRDGRALIEPAQLQAGERLRAEFTRAQMGPRLTTRWAAPAGAGRHAPGLLDPTEAALAARQRVRAALVAVGPEFAGLLLDVCCFLKRLEDVEQERGWPARSAKIVLQLALDRLARHYGYAPEARGWIHAQVRAWSADPTRDVADTE